MKNKTGIIISIVACLGVICGIVFCYTEITHRASVENGAVVYTESMEETESSKEGVELTDWEFDENGNIVGSEVALADGSTAREAAYNVPSEYMNYLYEYIIDWDDVMVNELPDDLYTRYVFNQLGEEGYSCYYAALQYFGTEITMEVDDVDGPKINYEGYYTWLFYIDGVPYCFYYNNEVVRIVAYDE